jgi:hypothetical protein
VARARVYGGEGMNRLSGSTALSNGLRRRRHPARWACVLMLGGLAPAGLLGAAPAAASGGWGAATAPLSGLSPAAGTSPSVRLGSLSCPASGSCVSVGHYTDTSGDFQGLIETLAAGTWTATTAPLSGLSPPPATQAAVSLDALACPASGSCIAVGHYTDSSGHTQGLIEGLAAGTWTASTAPLTGLSPSPGTDPQMNPRLLACPASGTCVAMGYYFDSSNHRQGLIESLAAGTWTASTVPSTGLTPSAGSDPNVYPRALNCPASGTCFAVASYNSSASTTPGLLINLSSGTWTSSTAPVSGLSPAAGTDPSMYLYAVACPASDTCVAGGEYTDASLHIQGLIDTLSSGTWTAITAPLTGLSPAAGNNPGAVLNALACPASGSCVAVGGYADSLGRERGLIESLAGGTWSAKTAPLTGVSPPASTNPNAPLNIMSCSASGSCVAMGGYTDSSGHQQGLVETLAAGTWTASSAPLSGLSPSAAGSPNVFLYAVSCPAASTCVGLGTYNDSGGNVQGLIETQTATATTTVQDSSPNVSLDSWHGVVDATASGGTYEVSGTQNATATFRFSGTSITWVTRKASDQGIAVVTINGASKGAIDLYSSSTQAQVHQTFSGLSSTAHTIVIKVTGSKNASSTGFNISIDAFTVGASTTQDSSIKTKYDLWAGAASSSASGGTYRSNAKAGATASLTFNGTGITWVTATGPSDGRAQVLIDGVLKGTFDLYASTAHWQATHLFLGLTSGAHTIVVKVLGTKNASSTGTKVVVDAFIFS